CTSPTRKREGLRTSPTRRASAARLTSVDGPHGERAGLVLDVDAIAGEDRHAPGRRRRDAIAGEFGEFSRGRTEDDQVLVAREGDEDGANAEDGAALAVVGVVAPFLRAGLGIEAEKVATLLRDAEDQ